MKTTTIKIILPNDILSKLEFAGISKENLEEMTRLQMAMWLLYKGVLSFGQAANFAGMGKSDFMDLTRRYQIPLFDMSKKEVNESRKRVTNAVKEILNESR